MAERSAARSRADRARLDAAAAELAQTSRAFSARNLHWALRRHGGRAPPEGYEGFVRGPLAARLREGPLPGLLPPRRRGLGRERLPAEWSAYFPAAILLVDRPELIDLVVASGVIIQARLAVVSLDGEPKNVVRWLADGFRERHRAPVGYLHDAATVVYPFAFEPLKTLVRVERRVPIAFRDLGLQPSGIPWRSLPFLRSRPPVGLPAGHRFTALEEIPPAAMVAHAVRALLELVPPDPLLLPLKGA
ncbi:MAG: hypothetical protein ACYCWW_00525 [Deltaproteobacteria bacterium]